MSKARRAGCAVGVIALVCAAPAWAGPPYVTDDPEPTDLGHWEIYDFVAGGHTPGVTEGEAGVDLNYGAAPDLQLTLVLPAAWSADHGPLDVGGGQIEIAAKVRVMRQTPGAPGLDVAVFPRLFVPTSHRFGASRVSLLLPVWAGRDFGPWSLFGGGGYVIAPGPGSRNSWISGAALTRTLTDRLSVGAEFYHHTVDAPGGRPFTGFNVGVIYKAAEHWSLLASTGPGLQNPAAEGRYGFYLALEAAY